MKTKDNNLYPGGDSRYFCKHENIYCEDCGKNFNDVFNDLRDKLAVLIQANIEFKQERDDLRRQLDKKWIPVSERLPEDGQKTLVFVKRFGVSVNCQVIMKFEGSFPAYVTHWQQLPEPPKEGHNET